MGKFYLETTNPDPETDLKVRYELHATSEISVTVPSSTTNYTIEKGDDVTDNVVVKNRKATLSGIVTDVSQSGFSVIGSIVDLLTKKSSVDDKAGPVEQYIEQLNERINNKETFSIYFSGILLPLHDCVITSFKYSKTNKYGGESWLISLSAQQIRYADRAKFVQEPTDDWKALVEKEKVEGGNKAPTREERIAANRNKGLLTAINNPQ